MNKFKKGILISAFTAVTSLCLGVVCADVAQPQVSNAEGGEYLSMDGKLTYNWETSNETQYIIYLQSSVTLPLADWSAYEPALEFVTESGATISASACHTDKATLLALYFAKDTFTSLNPTQLSVAAGTKLNFRSDYVGDYIGIEFTSSFTLTKNESWWDVNAVTENYISVNEHLSVYGIDTNETRYILYFDSDVDLPQSAWGMYSTDAISFPTDKESAVSTIGIGGGGSTKRLAVYFDLQAFNGVDPTKITIPAGTKIKANPQNYTAGIFDGIAFTEDFTVYKTADGWSLTNPETPVDPVERPYLAVETLTYDFVSKDASNYAIFFRSTVALPHLTDAWYPYKTLNVTVNTDKGDLTTGAIYGTDQSTLFGLYFNLEALNNLGATQMTIPAGTKIDANDDYKGEYAGIELKNDVTIYKTEGGWSHEPSVTYDEVKVDLATADVSFTYSTQFNRIQIFIPEVCDKFDAWKSLGGSESFFMDYGAGDKAVSEVQTNPDIKGLMIIMNDKGGSIYQDSAYITLKGATLYAEDYKLKIVLENSRTFSKDTEHKDLGNVTFQQTTGSGTLGFLSTCEYTVPMDAEWEMFNDFYVTAYKADGTSEQVLANLQNADKDHQTWLYVWIKGKTEAELADYVKITIPKDTTVDRDYGWKKGVKFGAKDVNYYNFEGSWGTTDPSTVVKEVVKMSYIHNEWNNMTGTNYGTYCTLLAFSSNIAVSNGSLVRENRRASILVNGQPTTADQLTYSHAHGRNTLLICINDGSLMVEGTTIELNAGFGFETATLGEGVKLELTKEGEKWVFVVASNEGMKPLFSYSASLGEEELDVVNNEIVLERTEGDAFDLANLVVGLTDKDDATYTATVEGTFDAALANGKYVFNGEEGANNTYTVLYKFDTKYGVVTVSVKLVITEKDSVAPVIDWVAGTDLTLDEGYEVSGITVSATDDVDGEVEVVMTWSDGAVVDGKLVAGQHTLTLTATDKTGNKAEIVVNVTVEGAKVDPPASDTGSGDTSDTGSDSGSVSVGGESGCKGCSSSAGVTVLNAALCALAAGLVCTLKKKGKKD